jgi:hypothetical protein
MKKFLVAMIASVALLSACSSIESTKVNSADISAANNAEAVAVIQATNMGLYLFFYFVPIFTSDLDTVVNKLLVAEAKALGGNKVELLGAAETPKSGIFALFGNILSPGMAQATGLAVK